MDLPIRSRDILVFLSLLFTSFVVFAQTYPDPYVDTFSPMSGPPGTVITVAGHGFTGATGAGVGNGYDAPFNVINDGSMTITVPADATTGNFYIGNPQHQAWSGSGFTVTSSGGLQPPYVDTFSPTSGAPGTVIAVSGHGFTGANGAGVGNGYDAEFNVINDGSMTITVPADATTGNVYIGNPQYQAWSGSGFTVTGTGGGGSALSIRVQGNHFVDNAGSTIQLRGVSYSGFELVPIQGWDPADPSGGFGGQVGGPKWSALQSWAINAVRIPLNEASWLGYACTDASSNTQRSPDPGNNVRSAVQTQVAQATAAGLYVILDLHWAAPGTTCPMLQSQMADHDNSIAFWTSVANTFKSNPAVMFELFNEPFFNFEFQGDADTAWTYLMHGVGGPFTGYPAQGQDAGWHDIQVQWAIADMQTLVDTVRATGATNVVLVAGTAYAQDLRQWLANRPTDSANQLAAVWHAYPGCQTVAPYDCPDPDWQNSASYRLPNLSDLKGSEEGYTAASDILAAGFPVIVTEFGDRNTAGTTMSPFAGRLLPRLDSMGISYLAWTWDIWYGGADDHDPHHQNNILIMDGDGTPTDGFGVCVKNHYLLRAGLGTAECNAGP